MKPVTSYTYCFKNLFVLLYKQHEIICSTHLPGGVVGVVGATYISYITTTIIPFVTVFIATAIFVDTLR